MADTPLTLSQADIDAAVKAAISEARADWDAETQGLKNKNRELLGKLRDAEGVKPEDLAAAETRAEKAEQALAEATKQVKALTTERDKAVKALETESAFTSKLLIQDGIKSALIGAGVKDEDFLDALSAKFMSGASVAVDGAERRAMLGDKPLSDALKEWAGTDAAKKYIQAPLNGGGGAPGGGGAGGSGKVASADQFAAMSAKDRAAFFASGGTLEAA